jgi:hypothetical protein
MTLTLDPPIIIPTTIAPSQTIDITLGGQACTINLYTKSINVPVHDPGEIVTDPNPRYENTNPVFIDLYVNNVLIIGGVLCRNSGMVVIDEYLGFVGDLSVIDTSGRFEDPQGVPATLPPLDLRNWSQRNFPLGDKAPANVAGTIPGMGTRWLLTWWPSLR